MGHHNRNDYYDYISHRRIMKRNPYQKPLSIDENYLWKVLGHLKDDLNCYLSTETSECLRKLIRNKDALGYLEFSDKSDLQCINRSTMIQTPIEAFAIHQIASLLKKYPFNLKGVDRKKNAMDKFFKTESYLSHFDFKSLIYRKPRMIEHLRTFISKVLGPLPSALSYIIQESHFGPGVSLGVPGGNISKFYKFSIYPYTCTESVRNLAYYLIDSDERWKDSLLLDFHCKSLSRHNLSIMLEKSKLFEVVAGNRLTTVPKTAICDRTIAVEPLLNVTLQLGVDSYLKQRLLSLNINLKDQSRNRYLASSLESATIDLENASDSISKKLISILLPGDWREFLKALRSPVGLIEGKTHYYEKFSSMGNGFTFALESLIFSSIVSLSFPLNTRSDWAIYGDDIIVNNKFAQEVIENLKSLGFSINERKTFVDGRVRESCGYDFFQNVNIRPIFIKKLPTSVKDLFSDHNRLLRVLNRTLGGHRFKTTDYIISQIPDCLRLYGPYSDEEYDTYIHVQSGRKYEHGLWKFNRLISKSLDVREKEFNFRRLMHDLKSCVSDSGSKFKVHKKDLITLKLVAGQSGIWTDTYAHATPEPPKFLK